VLGLAVVTTGQASRHVIAFGMNTRTKSIADEAEKLPAADRIRLIEHLLGTLDKPDPEIDRVWAAESECRLDAYLRGETTARDAKDVLDKHLKP
jgi:putative addiction module component (TIGR02574 family)